MNYSPRFRISFSMSVAIVLCICIPISKGLSTQCVFLKDCECYAWFKYTPKETVEAFLKEQGCGLDKEGNVAKGRKIINLINFSSRKLVI